MKSIGTMTAKQVRVGIREGKTQADFCKEYVCTREQLLDRLGHLYSKGQDLQKITCALENNEKLRRRHHTPKQQPAVQQVVEATREESQSTTETEKAEITDLDELKATEAKLSDEVIALENSHKDLYGKHHSHTKRLREIDQSIELIRSQLDAAVKEYTELIESARELEECMEQISATRRAQVSELTKVRQKIDELSRAVVAVYASGETEVIGGTLVPDETGHDDLYAKLRDDESLEELRMRDIKILARVLCIAKNAAQAVDFVFDSNELEAVYHRLAAN